MATSNWREISRQSFTQLSSLLDFLEFGPEEREAFDHNPSFPLLVPLRLAKKMRKRDPNDPLFRQFVPIKEEKVQKEGYPLDPVEDCSFRKESKLLQKYHGRSLLLTTSACAMHCRFCFRKNFPYDVGGQFENEFTLLEKDPSIEEVIFSGGDPLSLSNEVLKKMLERVNNIPHVQRIRFHTRFLIGIPERMDDSFLKLLAALEKQVIFVIHVNHPLELDKDVFASLKNLMRLGIPVITHTVLLKGVNDDVNTLKELFTHLVNQGVIPYCLNELDQVKGTHHFKVDREKGLSLIASLQECLSGYAVPHFVKEIAGKPSKTRLA